ncbi:helix-turn-helix domain-containing protein [Mucilaginibacter sp. CAU 1740]|uniref:helix-turn-helix domain-containing protein n=1 Tax=Mucilaginibacter sp. CAU 1740 TaxID=3140365 RepID=UPI00325BC0FC
MEQNGADSRAMVFVSCKREKHYSREVILPWHALVRVYAGEMRIVSADRSFIFRPGDTVLLPRNQLGRLSKVPFNGEAFKSVSVCFPQQMLQKYYTSIAQPVIVPEPPYARLLTKHPLLESLFNSLLPYFDLADELPQEVADIKVNEAIAVLRSIDRSVDNVLGHFEEPGKIDLADFMEKNYMFNLTATRFGYLTGRSLTTFKRDFKKAFGDTPEKWLTRKRLETAHYQIVEQKRKPSEVYFEVGFENLSHFSFAFKKLFGYNPTSVVGK